MLPSLSPTYYFSSSLKNIWGELMNFSDMDFAIISLTLFWVTKQNVTWKIRVWIPLGQIFLTSVINSFYGMLQIVEVHNVVKMGHPFLPGCSTPVSHCLLLTDSKVSWYPYLWNLDSKTLISDVINYFSAVLVSLWWRITFMMWLMSEGYFAGLFY